MAEGRGQVVANVLCATAPRRRPDPTLFGRQPPGGTLGRSRGRESFYVGLQGRPNQATNVVPKVRFELTRGFPQRILSPPRLPVPPLRPVQQGIAPAGPPKPRLRSPRPDAERRTSPAGSNPTSDSWHPRAQPGRATESGPGPTIEDDGELEATSGFEPLNRGFADLPLNHLGTSPRRSWPEGVRPDVRSTAERYGSLPLEDSNLG